MFDPVRLAMIRESSGGAAAARGDSLALAKGIAVTVFGLLAFIYVVNFTIFIWSLVKAGTWVGMACLPAAALAIAGGAFWMREIKKVRVYPFIEIAIGLGIATQVAQHTQDPVVVLIGLFGSVRVIIDGMKRLKDQPRKNP
jgi:hypothetical protein